MRNKSYAVEFFRALGSCGNLKKLQESLSTRWLQPGHLGEASMASPYQQQVLGGPMGTGMGPPLLSPQQQGGPGFAGAPDAGEPVQALQHKDLNTVMMCRVGQETVQEVVAKAIELFQNLKALQPPTGVASSMAGQEERRLKLQDTLRTVGMLFKRLHRVYNICSDCGPSAGSQYTPIEPDVTLQSLVPMKDEAKTSEEKKPSEVTRSLQEERARLTEQVVIKNRQLKEVLDALRNIIWEINTMLAMRKR